MRRARSLPRREPSLGATKQPRSATCKIEMAAADQPERHGAVECAGRRHAVTGPPPPSVGAACADALLGRSAGADQAVLRLEENMHGEPSGVPKMRPFDSRNGSIHSESAFAHGLKVFRYHRKVWSRAGRRASAVIGNYHGRPRVQRIFHSSDCSSVKILDSSQH